MDKQEFMDSWLFSPWTGDRANVERAFSDDLDALIGTAIRDAAGDAGERS